MRPELRRASGVLTTFVLTFLLAFGFWSPTSARAKREHIVHFPNTAYELNIYKIHGKLPGKTLMLIGGIQGNEPGGFLSADLYADMSLEKGNLIVVPRANFYSIILNKRGVNGDMNRKFARKADPDTMEDRIVGILKDLIRESDYLLNLHDGAGYYHPTYINKWRNPMRFGQSIIADCETYTVPGTDHVIRLGDIARKVIAAVNPQIGNELHRFHFMNTKTGAPASPHKEQRMSATFYALTERHIPAFGVETSKFLPSVDLKVRYHNLVINEFKKLFGIVPESPGLVLDPPVLKYLVISINGRTPIVIKDRETLTLAPNDRIRVTHIESNYERGLSLDILGHGDLNDFRKDFPVVGNTSIIVRKDNQTFAEIPIKLSSRRRSARTENAPLTKASSRTDDRVTGFVVETQGRRLLLESGETLDLVRGDTLTIQGIQPDMGPDRVTVNFKGFVGNRENNTGEDRGFRIHTDPKALMKRYALNREGNLYEVVVSRKSDEKKLGRLLVRLHPPRLDYLLLCLNDQDLVGLKPGDTLSLAGVNTLRVEAIRTNLFQDEDVHLRINGHTLHRGENGKLADLRLPKGRGRCEAVVRSGSSVLGSVYLSPSP
ncbi:MAG: M14/M99 family metallopeptidase [Desulfobacteraceae bacterium]